MNTPATAVKAAVRMLAITGLTVMASVLSLASPVMADGNGYPPGPGVTVITRQVTPPAAPAKVAFTGTNILQWIIVAAVLALVGSLLVLAARRKGHLRAQV